MNPLRVWYEVLGFLGAVGTLFLIVFLVVRWCLSGIQNWQGYLARTTAANFQINDSPRYVTFTHPGMDSTYLDRHTGHPIMARILLLLDDVFDFGVSRGVNQDGVVKDFINFEEFRKGNMGFVLGLDYTMSSAMYDPAVSKWPLDAKMTFGGFGKTSYVLSEQLYGHGCHEPLLTCVGKFVLVNQQTRKPNPFPDRVIKNLKGKEMRIPFSRMERLSRPAGTFVHSVKIVSSTTDENNHVHYTSYVQFGLDTLHLAVLAASRNSSNSRPQAELETPGTDVQDVCPIIWISDDIIKCGLRKLRISFVKECVEGDMVNIHIWQEEDDKLGVKCSVENMDNSEVHCQIIFEYFGPSQKL